MYEPFSKEFLDQTMEVKLLKRDILLIDEALRFLLQALTREEHESIEDIQSLLERLPKLKEQVAA